MLNYSFIIPHYNTPNLLQRLLDSIPQREDLEIIVIDDNSASDKKAYTSRPDVQIIFLDKETSRGAGKARNVGLDVAKGKWILFADADDYYKTGFLDVLDEYKDADIDTLFFNIEDDASIKKNNRKHRSKEVNMLMENYDGSKEKKEELMYLIWYIWQRMISRDFIIRTGCRFEEVPRANDVLFAFEIAYFTKTLVVDKRPLYVLTYFPQSITYKKMTYDSLLNIIKSLGRRRTFFKYIGHPQWANNNIFTTKGVPNFFIILSYMLRRDFFVGTRVMWHYITHYNEIHKQYSYYVDTIEILKKRQERSK